MAALEWIHFKWLPTPMKTTFKRKGRASSFPGGTEEDVERVRVHLDALTSLGPRVTGSIQLHTASKE